MQSCRRWLMCRASERLRAGAYGETPKESLKTEPRNREQLEDRMPPAPISLVDRAGLDRPRLAKIIGRGLEGADDGELFLEYRQSEMLVFDNGRLKQATYDTGQGFGLRAVKDDAVGYAHASDISEDAIRRAAPSVRAVRSGYSGHIADGPARTNTRLYS